MVIVKKDSFRHCEPNSKFEQLIITDLFSSINSNNTNLLPILLTALLPMAGIWEGKKQAGGFWILFSIIISLNFAGLWPGVAALTTQPEILLITLILFGTGLSLKVMSNYQEFILHMVPSGCPVSLSPFLVVIETLSVFIRPLTLALRLLANLSVGHVVTSLLSMAILSSPMAGLFMMPMIFLFELCVAVIQAYIYTLLISMYLEIFTHSKAITIHC